MDSGMLERIKQFYFIVIGVLMYYFITQIIDLGLYVTYRHAFALLIVFSAFICFLIKPDVARGVVAVKSAFIYSMPLIITFVVSLFIWFVNQVDVSVIERGLSSSFIYINMLSFALAGTAFLYIFGEKGIWYNLAAIIAANLLMILTIILQYGLGNYMSELIELITTFADKTGEIIVRAEVHELAFCIGAYIVFMLLKPQKSIPHLILFVLSLFCFISAFKRIGIFSIAIALAFGLLLKMLSKLSKRFTKGLIIFLTVMLMLVMIAYIAVIKMDVFQMLEDSGVDTTGRASIYSAVSKFYEFSPSFLGNGIGFLTYQLNTSLRIGVAAVHNDFLQYFIDLGFWGYILWLFSMSMLRVICFGTKKSVDNAIVVFSLTVYLFVVSTTDNTMNYPLLTTVVAVLMIGNGFDREVYQTEKKIFGYSPRKEKRGAEDI